MKLDTFRHAVLADARRDAERIADEAEREAQDRVRHASEEAEQERDQARRQGRETAERQMQRQRAEGHRQAQEVVLQARRRALERLREEALRRLRDGRDTDDHRALSKRLEQLAREQLGPEADIDKSPDGGLVAHADSRCVDYRLPAVVDRVLGDMAGELEELWT